MGQSVSVEDLLVRLLLVNSSTMTATTVQQSPQLTQITDLPPVTDHPRVSQITDLPLPLADDATHDVTMLLTATLMNLCLVPSPMTHPQHHGNPGNAQLNPSFSTVLTTRPRPRLPVQTVRPMSNLLNLQVGSQQGHDRSQLGCTFSQVLLTKVYLAISWICQHGVHPGNRKIAGRNRSFLMQLITGRSSSKLIILTLGFSVWHRQNNGHLGDDDNRPLLLLSNHMKPPVICSWDKCWAITAITACVVWRQTDLWYVDICWVWTMNIVKWVSVYVACKRVCLFCFINDPTISNCH